jgi:hypothetical protein
MEKEPIGIPVIMSQEKLPEGVFPTGEQISLRIIKSRKKYFEDGFQTQLAPHSLRLPDEAMKYFRDNMFVLNRGSGGSGDTEKKLRTTGSFMIELDINSHQIELAKQALLPFDKFEFAVADCTDMYNLVFKGRGGEERYLNQISNQAAIAQGMLSCLDPEDQEKAVKEIFRLLWPNSVLVINEFELDDKDAVQTAKHYRDVKITGYYPARVIWTPGKPQTGENILFITEDFTEKRLRELAVNAGFEILEVIRTKFLSGEGPIDLRERKQITVVAHKPHLNEQTKTSYLPVTTNDL